MSSFSLPQCATYASSDLCPFPARPFANRHYATGPSAGRRFARRRDLFVVLGGQRMEKVE